MEILRSEASLRDLIILASKRMKAICRFSALPIKIPMAFLSKLDQIILKFLWNLKGPQIAKTILSRTKLNVPHSLISGYATKQQ